MYVGVEIIWSFCYMYAFLVSSTLICKSLTTSSLLADGSRLHFLSCVDCSLRSTANVLGGAWAWEKTMICCIHMNK